MESTKKKGNNKSVHQTSTPDDVYGKLSHYILETDRLETAYAEIHSAFYHLKEKWEASHLTLQTLIAHMSEGMMFVTREGTIDLFNPAAAELLNSPIELVLRRPYVECFSDNLFGFSMIEEIKNSGKHRRIFLTLNAKKEIEISTSPIPGKGILLLLSNRTEQHQLQKSLSQAERLQELGEMAATLAHEIRNPLGGIEGFAHLLKRDLELSTHKEMIHAILAGTQTINALITQILDYAKPLCLHFASVDFVNLIQGACSFVQADHRATQYHFQSAHSHYIKTMDKDRILLVLLNLLRNAHEAGAHVVKINLSENGIVTIRDNGSGIDPQHLHKIFTPFFTTKARGTGLGLATSLAVVKAHGGKLEVASQEGEETQFTLTL